MLKVVFHMNSLNAIGTSEIGGLAGLPMHDPLLWLCTLPKEVKTLVWRESCTNGIMSCNHIFAIDLDLNVFPWMVRGVFAGSV